MIAIHALSQHSLRRARGTVRVAEVMSFQGCSMIKLNAGIALIPVLTGLLLVVGCGQPSAPAEESGAEIRLDLVWRTQGLANPESAALSADSEFLYVTNVNGEGDAKDGNGFIARVGIDGRILEREWARGLNAPKGIMLRGDALYVADIDELVVIDAAERRRQAARFGSRRAFPE